MRRLSCTWKVDLERRIGRGGYSEVYACKREGDTAGKLAAVKVFKKFSHCKVFEREVATLSAVEGVPNTPALLDWGENQDGQLCLVTELAPGVSLNRYIQDHGVLGAEQAMAILQAVLDTLRVAHDRGIVHLDIGPPNIMVSDEEIQLLDWGVSERSAGGYLQDVRANKEVVAPECLYGRACIASDFYSLAVTLFYALSGQFPYWGKTKVEKDHMMLAHCLQKPELPQQIPEQFLSLLYNWLNKNPARRSPVYDAEQAILEAEGGPEDFFECDIEDQLLHDASALRKGALSNIPYLQYLYAKRLIGDKQAHVGRYWLEQACGAGYHRAAGLLANQLERLSDASGTAQRREALLRFGIEGGDNRSRFVMARGILAGDYSGTEQEAVCLYAEAAEDGMPSAMYQTARHLLRTAEGRSEGIELLKTSSRMDYEKSGALLAQLER